MKKRRGREGLKTGAGKGGKEEQSEE